MKTPGKKTDRLNTNLSDDFPPATYREWREAVDKLLKGAPFEKIMLTQTYEGIELQPMYRKEDLDDLSYKNTFPDFAPYVRGTTASGYLVNSWQIAQEISCATPKEFNEALRQGLERGLTAVNLPLDSVTIAGLDSDHGRAGEVGKGGIAISTLEDLEKVLQGVDPEITPIFIQAGSAGIFATAFLAALCKKQGKNIVRLRGCVETDPLGELMQTGRLPLSLPKLYDEIATLTSWAVESAPNLQTIAAHADYFHNAGGSAVQELAFAVATGVDYIRELMARKLSIDEIAPRIRFTFSLGSNFFMEIAKLRAAKMLWSKVVEEFGGNGESQKMRIHARTSLWNKTAYDPYVNMLRVTTEAFSGIVGGCDSMHVGAFDEALRQPDEFSRRIARNTQIILKEESHLDRVMDPAGGSWYVESLTKEIAEKAWTLFQQVEKYGGMLKALEKGFPQEQVAETAKKHAENLAKRKEKFVGTNMYPNSGEIPLEPRQPDYQAIFKERARYLEHFRTSGDIHKHIAPLEKLGRILEAEPHKLMEALIDAANSSATIGEIRTTLRSGGGNGPQVTPLKLHRGAEMFEKLRKAMEAYKAKTGSAPKVFLANMGPASQHKARADFSTGFFQVGGIEVIDPKGFSAPAEAARAALDSGASIVVICSTDETYPDLVEPITTQIKQANPKITVVLAGYPKDQIEAHQKAGVDEFIHIRANVYEILEKLMKKAGVLP